MYSVLSVVVVFQQHKTGLGVEWWVGGRVQCAECGVVVSATQDRAGC